MVHARRAVSLLTVVASLFDEGAHGIGSRPNGPQTPLAVGLRIRSITGGGSASSDSITSSSSTSSDADADDESSALSSFDDTTDSPLAFQRFGLAGLSPGVEKCLKLSRCGASAPEAAGTGDGVDKEILYEAYNKLHSLARAYRKPFDAPAVVIVGAESSGKSALVEALMGFQFNEVGGGTRTRRPIALRMHYNADCDEPKCFLCDEGGETEASLQEVRAYVESENRRLERDAHREFDPTPIVVRVEYRHCPNLVLIDTPGLIDAKGGLEEEDGTASPKQRALRRAAREAYDLVLAKCKAREHVLLCVEDAADWNLGSIAREACAQADPTLSRTVVVNTKLDTKLLQFSSARDVGSFLRAKVLRELHPKLLAGPFFTTVPCGRVGKKSNRPTSFPRRGAEPEDSSSTSSGYFDYYDGSGSDEAAVEEAEDDYDDAENSFESDFDFRGATSRSTSADLSLIRSRLGADSYHALGGRVGVASLRSFLEKHVERVYRANVARVVPLLRHERTVTAKALKETKEEIEQLSPERLRRSAQSLADKFCKALASAVAGTVSAPPDVYGERLADERLSGGAFLAPASVVEEQDEFEDDLSEDVDQDDLLPGEEGYIEEEEEEEEERGGFLSRRRRGVRGGSTPSVPPHLQRRQKQREDNDNQYRNNPAPSTGSEPAMVLTLSQSALDGAVGHANSALYGGAQYRRALREFSLAVRHLSLPTIRASEIANALGVGDTHDGADLVRAACVIAIDKARRSFEPQLETLSLRVAHVMRRLPPVLDHILAAREPNSVSDRILGRQSKEEDTSFGSTQLQPQGPHARSMALVTAIYEKYVIELAENAMRRCQDDLSAMTRFVTWDLASSNADAAVRAALKPSPGVEQLYPDETEPPVNVEEDQVMSEWRSAATTEDAVNQQKVDQSVQAAQSDSSELVVALMHAHADSEATKSRVVGSLVRRIAAAWREHFARTVAVKFNCYFLMPFVNDFPFELRERVDDVCARGDDEFFDVGAARNALEQRRESLTNELTANSKLYETFDAIQRACSQQPASNAHQPDHQNIADTPSAKQLTDWDAAERAANNTPKY